MKTWLLKRLSVEGKGALLFALRTKVLGHFLTPWSPSPWPANHRVYMYSSLPPPLLPQISRIQLWPHWVPTSFLDACRRSGRVCVSAFSGHSSREESGWLQTVPSWSWLLGDLSYHRRVKSGSISPKRPPTEEERRRLPEWSLTMAFKGRAKEWREEGEKEEGESWLHQRSVENAIFKESWTHFYNPSISQCLATVALTLAIH